MWPADMPRVLQVTCYGSDSLPSVVSVARALDDDVNMLHASLGAVVAVCRHALREAQPVLSALHTRAAATTSTTLLWL